MRWAQYLLLVLVLAGATGAAPSEAAVCAADCGAGEQDACPPFCSAGPCANVMSSHGASAGVLMAPAQAQWHSSRTPAPLGPAGADIDHPPRG